MEKNGTALYRMYRVQMKCLLDKIYNDAKPIEKGSRQAKRSAAESPSAVRPKIKRKLSEDHLLGKMAVIRIFIPEFGWIFNPSSSVSAAKRRLARETAAT
eukprot:gene8066-10084_t